MNAADLRTTPAPTVEPPRAGLLGIGAPRLPAELDPASWVGLDAGEADGATPFHRPEDRDYRPLSGYEYEAVRSTLLCYAGMSQDSWVNALAARHDVARKLGVDHVEVRPGRHGWEISRKARVRL